VVDVSPHPFQPETPRLFNSLQALLSNITQFTRAVAPNRWAVTSIVEVWGEALTQHGPTEIFYAYQGEPFTSDAFTTVLNEAEVVINMDGKGRWVDNVFLERLWRSVQYEDVYLRAYDSPAAIRAGLTHYFQFYNTKRRHQRLNRQTPDAVYYANPEAKKAAQ
jgi:putative transposase